MTRLKRLSASALFVLASACSDSTTHVLVGNAYDPSNQCLAASAGFALVDGPEPSGQCPPTCVIDARTGTAFVTVTCPPYPLVDLVELQDATTGAGDPCASALVAWSGAVACGTGGASPDGGAEAGEGGLIPDGSAAEGGESDASGADAAQGG